MFHIRNIVQIYGLLIKHLGIPKDEWGKHELSEIIFKKPGYPERIQVLFNTSK